MRPYIEVSERKLMLEIHATGGLSSEPLHIKAITGIYDNVGEHSIASAQFYTYNSSISDGYTSFMLFQFPEDFELPDAYLTSGAISITTSTTRVFDSFMYMHSMPALY